LGDEERAVLRRQQDYQGVRLQVSERVALATFVAAANAIAALVAVLVS